MKLFYACLTVLWVSQTMSAQSQLSGNITNEIGEPISATIYLPQLEIGTVSNLEGTYSLSPIPRGTYKVVFSSLGHSTQSLKLNFETSENIVQDVVLTESAVEMEAVILSTPFHKLQSDNVMKVDRVTMDALQKSGAINLSQGIANIAGVSTISTGSGIGKPVIRGLSSNRVLTYTQGIRLENQQFGDEHGLGLSASGVESVEVIKGPASLLYGSDALGGVLYINPERFAANNSFAADASTSYDTNTLGSQTSLGVKSSGEKVKFLLRGGYASLADYETGNGSRVTNTRYKETDLKAGVRYQQTRFKSTIRYNYNASSIGIPETVGAQTTSRDLELPFQEIDNHILSFDNTLFFSNSSLDVKAGYSFNDRREFEDSREEAALQMKLNTITYDVKYHLPEFGKFETIAGIQGMFQENSNFGEEILIPDARKTDFGIFATTHYHLEKIDLQAGLRWDTRKISSEAARDPSEFNFIPPLEATYNSFNAALGAKVNLSEQLLTRLNVASGFRAPNLAELTSNGVHEGTNRYEIGNPNLTNERNVQTDLSLEFRNEHFEVFANGFYNSIANYIFITPTGATIDEEDVFDYIQADAYLYGGEFGIHVHPHPLDWLHVESSFETVTGKLNDGGFLPLIPANTLRNTLRFEKNEGKLLKKKSAFVSLENTFAQRNNSIFETESAGYTLLSAGINTQIDLKAVALLVGASVTNLTNETYITHLSRLKVDGIPNVGRSVQLNLKFML